MTIFTVSQLSLRFARKSLLFSVIKVMASSSPSTGPSTEGKPDLSVKHNTEKNQFYIDLDPPNRAILDYEFVSNGTVDMYHTGVPTAYRGHGIAAVLAKAAFAHFTSNETKMLLTCTYLQKYYNEHPGASKKHLITIPGQT